MAHEGAATAPLFHPPDRVRDGAHVTSMDEYTALHKQSIEHPREFWGQKANEFLVRLPAVSTPLAVRHPAFSWFAELGTSV